MVETEAMVSLPEEDEDIMELLARDTDANADSLSARYENRRIGHRGNMEYKQTPNSAYQELYASYVQLSYLLPVNYHNNVMLRDGNLADTVSTLREISQVPENIADALWERVCASDTVLDSLDDFEPLSEADLQAYVHGVASVLSN